MKLWLLLPILIPLFTALLSIGVGTYTGARARFWQRVIPLTGGVAVLAAALYLMWRIQQEGIQAVQVGDWPAPFGITLVADLFSAIMTLMAAIVGLACMVYALWSVDRVTLRLGLYPFMHLMLMGINGAFLTGDLFNLYVWFEVMLIASFVLLALGGRPGQLAGAMKYVTINLVASALFLAAAGMIYGVAGTLNLADLALRLPQVASPGLTLGLGLLLFTAFGIKSAIFPLYFWLPDVYPLAPPAVMAIFNLLTKVGVYVMTRVFSLLFTTHGDIIHPLLLTLAGLTMVTGVLGAAVQTDIRRILSFHSVSQIGYMLLGIGFFTPLGLAAAIFYIVHYLLVKVNLFLVGGALAYLQGSFDLKHLGGFYRERPGLAVLFFAPAFALAGLPPFSGFWAKLGLVQAGLAAQQGGIVAVSLAVSLFTLYSMTKIWAQAFWKPAPRFHVVKALPLTMLAPIVVLATLTLVLSLAAEPFLQLATQAAAQLMDATLYQQAVLGP